MTKKFDPTKPYCRRDGKPARIVHTFRTGNHMVILDNLDDWIIVNSDGEYEDSGYNDNDLINIPEKHEGWLNVYKPSLLESFSTSHIYSNKKQADCGAICGRIACIKVSFTEGEGLDK